MSDSFEQETHTFMSIRSDHLVVGTFLSSTRISTGNTIVLNLAIVRPILSLIEGSQPSGIRSSSRRGLSVSTSPPKIASSVDALGKEGRFRK